MTVQGIARVTSLGGFFLLFPGFVFYHYFVSSGLLPAFAGGLFGPVALAAAIIYVLILPVNISNIMGGGAYSVAVFGFILYVFGVTLSNYASFNLLSISLAADQSFTALIMWVSLFFIGLHLPVESKTLQLGSAVCGVAITLFLAHYVATTGSVFFYAAELYGVEEGVATYQGFARSSLGLWALLVVSARSEFYRWFMVASGIFVLFVLGARSELFAFMTLSLLLVLAIGIRSVKALLLAAIASGIIVALVIGNLDALRESRQLQILDLRSSSSWNAREVLADEAWEVVKENPIWGRFGSHVIRGSTGSYAHNYLSAWENYGIIGVSYYLILILIACIVGAYRCFSAISRYPVTFLLSFVVNTICLILVLFSKPVFWPLVAFGWGLHAKAVGQWHSTAVNQQDRPSPLPSGYRRSLTAPS